jgi:rSAM/selenodomain-associated transferase 2/rSAM/selenodomain-associated transferase 1
MNASINASMNASINASITVCIFAKPPIAGQVKTRLAEPARAAERARAFRVDTGAAVRAVSGADPVVATTGDLDPDLARELAVPAWLQGDGDLGARLERVLQRSLEGAPGAIAIGADTPGLPRELLDRARAALLTADAAIGPSEDGGFYLLALRRCPDGLLADLPWSRSDTFAATIARLHDRGLSTVVLEPWFDVDRPAELARLRTLLRAGAVVAPATRRALAAPMISVVMPVLNEEKRIERALAQLAHVRDLHEVIVVDGGSTDRTRDLARAHRVRVITAPRGRGPQLHAGAAIASGDVVLFLHADTTLPPDAADHVTHALAQPRAIAGAFRTWTIADEPKPWFAPLLHLADLRSRLTRYPYGDQAMFVRADAFRAAGGFADVPLMEDLELSRRLWRQGRIYTCAASVRVSGRRFVARPIVYTALVNIFPALFRAGVSPRTLARFYRQVR